MNSVALDRFIVGWCCVESTEPPFKYTTCQDRRSQGLQHKYSAFGCTNEEGEVLFSHFDRRGRYIGNIVHGLETHCGSSYAETQAFCLDDRYPLVDAVVAEAVSAQRILSSEHLSGADGSQDLQLIEQEALWVDDGLVFDLRFGLGDGEGAFGAVGEHGSVHLLHDRFAFFRGVVFECVEAEFHGVVDLFLAELAALIRSSLDE